MLHSKQILYRDLQMSNLLVDERGYLKIVDLAMAKKFRTNQTVVVTDFKNAAYAAPEVLAGRGYSMASDWWAVGVIAYELVFDVTPYKNIPRNKSILDM